MKHSERLIDNIQRSIAAKQAFMKLGAEIEAFERAVTVVVAAYRKHGRLYIAGNGGSAADAQHLAAEFVSKLARERAPLPAEALTVDSSILTAIGNDYGFEHVFARQIAGKMRPDDVFLGITTSGKSLSIIRALEQCRAMHLTSVVFSGRGGGAVKGLADHCIVAAGEETSAIQELQIVLAHTLCGCVEADLFGEPQ